MSAPHADQTPEPGEGVGGGVLGWAPLSRFCGDQLSLVSPQHCRAADSLCSCEAIASEQGGEPGESQLLREAHSTATFSVPPFCSTAVDGKMQKAGVGADIDHRRGRLDFRRLGTKKQAWLQHKHIKIIQITSLEALGEGY